MVSRRKFVKNVGVLTVTAPVVATRSANAQVANNTFTTPDGEDLTSVDTITDTDNTIQLDEVDFGETRSSANIHSISNESSKVVDSYSSDVTRSGSEPGRVQRDKWDQVLIHPYFWNSGINQWIVNFSINTGYKACARAARGSTAGGQPQYDTPRVDLSDISQTIQISEDYNDDVTYTLPEPDRSGTYWGGFLDDPYIIDNFNVPQGNDENRVDIESGPDLETEGNLFKAGLIFGDLFLDIIDSAILDKVELAVDVADTIVDLVDLFDIVSDFTGPDLKDASTIHLDFYGNNNLDPELLRSEFWMNRVFSANIPPNSSAEFRVVTICNNSYASNITSPGDPRGPMKYETTIRVETPPKPSSNENPPIIDGNTPQDLDNDGKYEDIDGNGEFNFVDVNKFFRNTGSEPIENNTSYFDFNDSGDVNLQDVLTLFNQV